MVPELENARVTELHVRMHCNRCVQRIKKATSGIEGVYSVRIDFAQQKLTVIGNADPEMIVRAIKKRRRIATICSHTESGEPLSDVPPGDAPPAEAPADAAPPTEPTPETLAPEAEPPTETKDITPTESTEVHMVHHYPHNYIYREQWNSHNYPPSGHELQQHEAPYYVTQSYNNYRPLPSVTEYAYLQSPPMDRGGRDGNQINSMFSDENPNACTIV